MLSRRGFKHEMEKSLKRKSAPKSVVSVKSVSKYVLVQKVSGSEPHDKSATHFKWMALFCQLSGGRYGRALSVKDVAQARSGLNVLRISWIGFYLAA